MCVCGSQALMVQIYDGTYGDQVLNGSDLCKFTATNPHCNDQQRRELWSTGIVDPATAVARPSSHDPKKRVATSQGAIISTRIQELTQSSHLRTRAVSPLEKNKAIDTNDGFMEVAADGPEARAM
jgi:hypothetical protein